MKEVLYDFGGLNAAVYAAMRFDMTADVVAIVQAVTLTAEPRVAPLAFVALVVAVRFAGPARWTTGASSLALKLAVAFLLSLSVAWGVKLATNFPRPWTFPGLGGAPATGLEAGASFPSGHAVVAAALVVALWSSLPRPWMKFAGLAWVGAVVLSRIVLGAHFPADLLWGLALGFAGAYVARILLDQFDVRGDAAWPFVVAVSIFVVDVLTKGVVVSLLPFGSSMEVAPVVSLVYWLNPGAAFGLLSTAGAWQRGLLLMVGVAASTWLVWAIAKSTFSRAEKLALGAILGGALANVFDRMLHGAVVDWIDMYWAAWHWPAFNVADAGISLGALSLLVLSSRLVRKSGAGVVSEEQTYAR
jgi:signal peptidase II